MIWKPNTSVLNSCLHFLIKVDNYTGNYSCLQVSLNLDRDIGHIWSATFCPDILTMVLIVLSSCLALNSVLRFTLLVSVLVSHLILATAGLRHLDKRQNDSDEWTALDIWNNATIGFIYAAFVELILVRNFDCCLATY